MIYFIILLVIMFIYALIDTILRAKEIDEDKEYKNKLNRLADEMRAARDKENK